MKTFSYKIKDELGIHARPAGNIVKLAKNYESTITLKYDGKEANATRLMAIMSMCVKQGAEITVTVEGNDEDKAMDAMMDFFNNNL